MPRAIASMTVEEGGTLSCRRLAGKERGRGMQQSLEPLKRCTRCKFIRSLRPGLFYCKLGRLPENCSRVKRRTSNSRKLSGRKPIREVVLRGDEEVD